MSSSQSAMVRIHTSDSKKFFSLQLLTWFQPHSLKVCHFLSSSCNTWNALRIKQSVIMNQRNISHPLPVLINQPFVCLVSPGYFKTNQRESHLCHKRGQSFLLHKCITDSLTLPFLYKLWAAAGFQSLFTGIGNLNSTAFLGYGLFKCPVIFEGGIHLWWKHKGAGAPSET